MEKAVVGKDTKAIWTDCPKCARKHLSAAYALLTQVPPEAWTASPYELLISRALITYIESLNGYPGNRALASGCIAAAEGWWNQNSLRTISRLREIRLQLDAGPGVVPDMLEFFTLDDGAFPSTSGTIGAHVIEAMRELPELQARFDDLFSGVGFGVRNPEELPDRLVKAIRWVEETYALQVEDLCATVPKDYIPPYTIPITIGGSI